MKRIGIVLLTLSLCLHTYAQDKIKKAVFIIVDGIPADVIEKLNPPNFGNIAKAGGFAKTRVGGEKGGYTQRKHP